MVDCIRISFYRQIGFDQLQHEMPGLKFDGQKELGKVTIHYGRYGDLTVDVNVLKETLLKVVITGSLHKYAHGRNDDSFSFGEIQETVKRFMEEFHVPGNAPLHRVELGVNLPFKYPEAVIDAAMLYTGHIGDRSHSENYYANDFYFNGKKGRLNYRVKLYRKGKHLLRYEHHIEDLRKISKKTGIKLISDLLDDSKLLRALSYLYGTIDNLFFVPEDYKHTLPPSLAGKMSTYRADTFWLGLQERRFKDKKCKAKKEIKQIILDNDLINWNAVMRQRFLVEGANLAGMTADELAKTISHLRYQCETVDDPTGGGDRQADVVKVGCIILIPDQREVYITHCSLDVSISASLSDYFVLIRGPPSL